MDTLTAVRTNPVEIGAGLRRRFADYFELTKPKIATMALVTVAVGFLLGAAPNLNAQGLLHTLVGAAVVAAGGSALNHWLERRADAKMNRTANRPVVTGRIHPNEALVFGSTLSVLGTAYLWIASTPAAAIAALATFVLYVVVYTPLKQITTWNTVVGAIPGALPPVIGWCGATGSMAPAGWALFAILFVWQLPHFYSIAYLHRDDYARGGMKMLPMLDRNGDGRITGWATFGTSLLLLFTTALPFALGAAGWIYLIGALPVALWFLLRCYRFARNRNKVTARSVLRGSLIYLLAAMALFVADGVVPRYFTSAP